MKNYIDRVGRETTMRPVKNLNDLAGCKKVVVFSVGFDPVFYTVIGLHPIRKNIILESSHRYVEHHTIESINNPSLLKYNVFEYTKETGDERYILNRMLEDAKMSYLSTMKLLKNGGYGVWKDGLL